MRHSMMSESRTLGSCTNSVFVFLSCGGTSHLHRELSDGVNDKPSFRMADPLYSVRRTEMYQQGLVCNHRSKFLG